MHVSQAYKAPSHFNGLNLIESESERERKRERARDREGEGGRERERVVHGVSD